MTLCTIKGIFYQADSSIIFGITLLATSLSLSEKTVVSLYDKESRGPKALKTPDEKVARITNVIQYAQRNSPSFIFDIQSYYDYRRQWERSLASSQTAAVSTEVSAQLPRNPASTVSESALWALRGYARLLAEAPHTTEKKCILTRNGSNLQVTIKVNRVLCAIIRVFDLIFCIKSIYQYTSQSLESLEEKNKQSVLQILEQAVLAQASLQQSDLFKKDSAAFLSETNLLSQELGAHIGHCLY